MQEWLYSVLALTSYKRSAQQIFFSWNKCTDYNRSTIFHGYFWIKEGKKMSVWGYQLFLYSVYRILENLHKMSQSEGDFRFLQMSGTIATWNKLSSPSRKCDPKKMQDTL